jgi:hypothetical protein
MDWQSLLNSLVALLLGAFLLDLAIGDPRWLLHPVVLMGKAISHSEVLLRSGNAHRDFLAGMALSLFLVTLSAVVALGLVALSNLLPLWLSFSATAALSVALACLKDAGFTSKTELWLEKERQFLSERLTAIEGLHPFASQANFLLVKIDRNGADALQLRSFLSRKKILIRACDAFAGLGANYFRVAVKRRKDNLRLLSALREWTASSIG